MVGGTRRDEGPPGPVLHRAGPRVPAALVLGDAERRVLSHDRGLLRVLGGPGTGRSTLLAERVARLLEDRTPGVLVLVGDRRAAAALRERIVGRRRALWADGAAAGAGPDDPVPRAAREPLVRSVHSYAFAVLGRHATRRGESPPRLLPGAQHSGDPPVIFLGLGEKVSTWLPCF